MENYNINRNREPLSESDIAKGKDFNSFMDAYGAKQPSFFKTTKFYVVAAVTGIVLVGGGYLLLNNNDSTLAENNPAFIQSLFDGARDADTGFVVDATQGGMFMNQNGSMINVPGFAFLDSAGNKVSGNVELRYKEYHDPAAIFMAGIPMTYDSASARFHFESAGMIEITAWQNGKPLKTNPDSAIHVAMISDSDEERFNTYYLDTVAKNWKYINDEKATVFGPPVEDTVSTIAKNEIGSAPVPPKIADKNKPSFAIAFDPTEFPELVAYKGVRFEVDETVTPYNKDDKKVQWEDVLIQRVKNRDVLRVTFTAGTREAVYTTQPVVDEKDFAAAKKSWEKRNAEYQQMLKSRGDKEQKEADAREAVVQNAERHRIWVNDTLAERARQSRIAGGLQASTQSMVMREFIIADFGIWNSDCPEALPDEWMMFATLLDGTTGKALDANQIYLVEKGRNAIFTYSAADMKQFKYNPEMENMLWAITRDGKLATISVDDFKNMAGSDKKQATFKFTVSTDKLTKPEEARKQLDIPPPVSGS
ncbi:MAG TPA: hypothetical protein VK826_08385 [Bacteroidia bacterium]|nr:hypothetical protein [Bacteroidia bacterium]